MNRRTFLTVLLSSAVLPRVVPRALPLTKDSARYATGYNSYPDVTWLRVSILQNDGREWHDLIYVKGDQRHNSDELIRAFQQREAELLTYT